MKPRYQFDIKRMNADCETNYLRLTRLMPSLPDLADDARSQADAESGRYDCDAFDRALSIEFAFQHHPAHIEIAVTEQCRFTTTLKLSVSLESCIEGESAESSVSTQDLPDELAETELFGNSLAAELSIRMYHDVRLAEVVAIDGLRARWASYGPDANHGESISLMFQPDEKAQQNRFLGELLSLSLHHGMVAETSEHFDLLASMMRASQDGEQKLPITK